MKWSSLRLKYSEAIAILRTLDVDHDIRILVIGDPDNGAYEWAIERSGNIERHSDAGYGIADVALRDGLIAYYGLPTAPMREMRIR
jgi:hypothetical protein